MTEPTIRPVNPCTQGKSFCGQHGYDCPPPAVAAEQAPATDHRLSVQHADALWDAVAIPGPTEPTFTEQHQRVCKAVADILDEMTPAAVLPASVDQAAVLAEVDWIIEHCPEHGCVEPETEVCHCEITDRLRRLAASSAVVVRRTTDETPGEVCGPVPDQCDPDGEPCANHEREQAHAEGEHCFCGPECDKACTCGVAGDAFVPAGHYADCPQATPPAADQQQPKENRP